MANDCYSTRSAYRIQLSASYTRFRYSQIWKAQAENRCKVFGWILVQEKILTADNLQKRGWPHQEHCVLCDGPLETGLHLALLCPFAKAAWNQVLAWEDFDTQLANTQPEPMHIDDWWDKAAHKVPKPMKRQFNRVVIHTIWNI